MTAFNELEHNIMRGIWLELETMNRSLTLLVELCERQEQAAQVTTTLEVAPDVEVPQPSTTPPEEVDTMAAVKANRRLHGWCLLCGATRRNAGKGCYEIESTPNGPKAWVAHSWPEETPE